MIFPFYDCQMYNQRTHNDEFNIIELITVTILRQDYVHIFIQLLELNSQLSSVTERTRNNSAIEIEIIQFVQFIEILPIMNDSG